MRLVIATFIPPVIRTSIRPISAAFFRPATLKLLQAIAEKGKMNDEDKTSRNPPSLEKIDNYCSSNTAE